MSTGLAQYDPEMDEAMNTDQLRAIIADLKGQLADERLECATYRDLAAKRKAKGTA